MPLIQSTETTRRLDLPTDLPGIAAGDWVEISTVYTAAMRLKAYNRSLRNNPDAPESSDPFVFRQTIIEAAVRAWSDSEPVSPDSLASLHPLVQDWISTQFYVVAAGITPEGKDNSNSSSLPGSAPAAPAKDRFPASSGT